MNWFAQGVQLLSILPFPPTLATIKGNSSPKSTPILIWHPDSTALCISHTISPSLLILVQMRERGGGTTAAKHLLFSLLTHPPSDPGPLRPAITLNSSEAAKFPPAPTSAQASKSRWTYEHLLPFFTLQQIRSQKEICPLHCLYCHFAICDLQIRVAWEGLDLQVCAKTNTVNKCYVHTDCHLCSRVCSPYTVYYCVCCWTTR